MKTVTVFEAKNQFSRVLRDAAKDIVIVTRRGKPVAAIQRVTEDDLEDFLLERSETFWTMVREARKGKSISLDEVRKKIRR